MGYTAQGGVTSAASAVLDIANDPHIGEVTCQVLRLRDIEARRPLGPPCTQIPTNVGLGRGIGLRHAVGPLRLYVKAQEKPLLKYAALSVLIGGIAFVGFTLGRASKRGR